MRRSWSVNDLNSAGPSRRCGCFHDPCGHAVSIDCPAATRRTTSDQIGAADLLQHIPAAPAMMAANSASSSSYEVRNESGISGRRPYVPADVDSVAVGQPASRMATSGWSAVCDASPPRLIDFPDDLDVAVLGDQLAIHDGHLVVVGRKTRIISLSTPAGPPGQGPTALPDRDLPLWPADRHFREPRCIPGMWRASRSQAPHETVLSHETQNPRRADESGRLGSPSFS